MKDRAAAQIVQEAFRSGDLGPGQRLLDSTSGNTGISYAMLGAACGFGVTLCVPSNVSVERKRILSAYGAEVVYTDPGEGSDGAIVKARELIAAEPEKYFYADQYSNHANWHAHYCGTPTRSGGRPADSSPTSSPCWVPLEHLSAPLADCASCGPKFSASHCSPIRLSTALKAQSTCLPRLCRRLRCDFGGCEPGDQHRGVARHGAPAGS